MQPADAAPAMGALRHALAGLLLAACLPFAPVADAVSLYRWRDHGAVPQGVEPSTGAEARAHAAPSRVTPDAAVTLRLEDRGGHYLAWADNALPGPVEVRLHYRRADNVVSAPALPARATVPARGSTVVARLYPADPRQASGFELLLDGTPGDPAARPRDFEYRLPFDHGPVRIDQGFGGRYSHDDAQNYHALDFAVPEGTPVLAARDGVVMQVESDFAQAGLDRERYGGRANFVRILHDDGSLGLYAHLQWDGVRVRPGQRVRQGERIALSGNTGFSTAPHLHFAVQVNRGGRLESIPFRMAGVSGEPVLARSAATTGGIEASAPVGD